MNHEKGTMRPPRPRIGPSPAWVRLVRAYHVAQEGRWMMRSAAAAVLIAVILLDVSASMAQSSDDVGALRRDIEALKTGQDAVLKELQEIRALLRQRPAAPAAEPRDIVLGIGGAPFKGYGRAKLVLIDFSDYQCPFCARHLRGRCPSSGPTTSRGQDPLRLRDFPLDSSTPRRSRPPRPPTAPASRSLLGHARASLPETSPRSVRTACRAMPRPSGSTCLPSRAVWPAASTCCGSVRISPRGRGPGRRAPRASSWA